ncbi:MAG TPA: PIN domain-containing protein [Solirubrobacteraceae bacterium]|nr:PIN domain-containing protein [Solirubrobacteraceae bacterium]
MPGRPDSASGPAAWGELPLLVDTSAWARAHRPGIREPWIEVLRGDRLRLSPVVKMEILMSARNGSSFDSLAEHLSALRVAPLTPSVLRSAEDAMRALAGRSDGAQRLPIVDYLVAAAAQETGAAVIHYDRDYDLLAEIMSFESIWLSPPGSLP